mgnify:CR=1
MPTKAPTVRLKSGYERIRRDWPQTKTVRWQKVRREVLRRDPLCVVCLKTGRIVYSEIADHVIPHKGRDGLFWAMLNIQGLCKPCHDAKTRDEIRAAR